MSDIKVFLKIKKKKKKQQYGRERFKNLLKDENQKLFGIEKDTIELEKMFNYNFKKFVSLYEKV